MCDLCSPWERWISVLESRPCLCGSLHEILQLLNRFIAIEEPSCCCISSLASFLRVFLSALCREVLCSSIAELGGFIKRIKVELGAFLHAAWVDKGSHDPYLRACIENVLFPLIYVLPCHPQPCESLCRQVLSSIKPIKSILPHFLTLLHWDEDEESPSGRCLSTVHSHGERDKHRSSSIKYIGVTLCSQWKSLHSSLYASDRSSYRDKHIFMSVWSECIRLHTSACYPGFKNYISHLYVLLPSTGASGVLWKMELSVLNTALCYGSTLGLQNDIPSDIFSLSQRLISLSKSKDYYDSLSLTNTPSPPGIAGHLAIVNDEHVEESKADLSTGHSLILLHLKAIAVLVREAQCCSSSEESDASSSGTESLNNQDLINIEKSILEIVKYLTEWMRTTFLFQHEASFLSMFMKIFREQDDVLIEGLLCLLDIYIGSKITSEDLSPLAAFQLFAESISLDHSVLLDFLLSNETCFLLYFLRFLKYLNRGSRIHLLTSPPFQNVHSVLSNLKVSVDKLTDKGLFPYDISPVHKLLKHLIH